MRQFVEKIEAAHDESRTDKKHRASKNREHDPDIEARIMERITVELRRGLAGEPVVAQKNQDARDDDQRDKTDHPIEQDRQQRARFFARGLLPKQIGFHHVAAGAAGKELIVKHPDQK